MRVPVRVPGLAASLEVLVVWSRGFGAPSPRGDTRLSDFYKVSGSRAKAELSDGLL